MIVFPDAEALVIEYLTSALPTLGITVPVSDRVPQTGKRSITVTRTGGTKRDLVTDNAQITLDVRGTRNSECVEVISACRALLGDLWGGKTLQGHAIYSVGELSGPYSNPTDSDLNRYSQSFLVAIRAYEVVV